MSRALFSPRVRIANNIEITSGLLPACDPEADFETQVKSLFDRVAEVLARNNLADIASVDVWIEAPDRETFDRRFAQFNQLYDEWLADVEVMPARAAVGVACLAKGYAVEMRVFI